nr:hypothetical protein [uncultured Pseudodesulfovibrio sp.]
MNIEMDKINQVREQALALLKEAKNEWEDVYAGYSSSIENNIEKIKAKKSTFNEWAPLYLYSTAGDAKGSANSFQLRYMGQNVAGIKVNKDSVLLSTSHGSNDYTNSNMEWFNYDCAHKNVNWSGAEAAGFRKHFSMLGADSRPRQLEHKYECMILSEMGKKDKESKFQGTFSGVQPVKIANVARFQMKTPLKASEKDSLAYSTSGGGIDILARVGTGRPTLSVFELKEPNISNPQAPIEQGLAYTIFLRELLRSKSGAEWYRVFGYTGELPAKLKLNCIVLMGDGAKTPKFDDRIIPIEQDEIHLHHMLYKEKNGGIEITETSLT